MKLVFKDTFVSANDGNSNLRFITKGIPQGSTLGPLLFLIDINDLANCTSLFTLLFADDTSFLISGENLYEVVELLNVECKRSATGLEQINFLTSRKDKIYDFYKKCVKNKF